MTDKLILLPAVDVADGKAVRLVQGEAGTETDYGTQPMPLRFLSTRAQSGFILLT